MKVQVTTQETDNDKNGKKKHHPRSSKLSKDDESLMTKNSVVQLRLTEEKKQEWEKVAKKEDKSMTQFVIDSVDDYIQNRTILELLDTKFKDLKKDILKEIRDLQS